jgi:hypothetical protein
MQVDVVATYYRQFPYTTAFLQGIKNNEDFIANLWIANREPWSLEERRGIRGAFLGTSVWVRFLEHPYSGRGAARALNQGLRASQKDYVFLTTYDQILPEKALETITGWAQPKHLVLGAAHSLHWSVNERPLEEVSKLIERYDAAKLFGPRPIRLPIGPHRRWTRKDPDEDKNWELTDSAHALVHRPAHLVMGEFDEGLHGQVAEGLEWGIRWAGNFGVKSVKWAPSQSFRFHEPNPQEKPSAKAALKGLEAVKAAKGKYGL